MSRKSVQLSKEHLDIETRNVVRKVAHRPLDEVVQIVRERTKSAPDREYIAKLLKEYTL